MKKIEHDVVKLTFLTAWVFVQIVRDWFTATWHQTDYENCQEYLKYKDELLPSAGLKGLGLRNSLELQTKVREDFTIKEKIFIL